MIIEMQVAIALTITVTRSVRRVLQMSWEKTSWPICVVPSRCFDDAPRFGGYRDACGRSGATRPGNAAMNTITSRIRAPAVALRLPRTARMKRRPRAASTWPAPSAEATPRAETPVAISGLPGPRIEHRGRQIGKQHTDEHGKRVEQEQPLHQGQVVIRRGGVEEIAEARVGEQVLDHDRAAQD